MLTISQPISAAQAREYHRAEFANASDNYFSENQSIEGRWHGQLATAWGLDGEVSEAHFSRLSEGQHPFTCEQLVSHQTPRSYLTPEGKTVRTLEHRCGWDATFSAPKTVSLTALVGDDKRILIAHKESVTAALDETERFVQARIGGNTPAETTGQWVVARFEHDSSRPVDGYAAPQVHTHCVIFNLTTKSDGVGHALQPHELFKSQKYATAVYRAELAVRLKSLGYEIQRGEHGSPEIKGYSREYIDASSPRRRQIEQHLAEHGVRGAEAAQIAAHQTRGKKLNLSRETVVAQHQVMAVQYGNQPATVVSQAHGRDSRQSLQREPSDMADQGIRSAIARNTEREAVIDERAVLADALRHEMGFVRTAGVKNSLATAVQRGTLIEMPQREGRGSRAFTTPEMKQCEAEVLQCMVRGLGTCEELVFPSISRSVLESHSYLNESQHAAAAMILGSRDRIMGLEGKAGTGKTTTLKAVCEAAKKAGFQVEGLAPTSRAALNLADAEIPTKTMARHLMESQGKASGTKHLYIVDESSLASTRQANDLLKTIQQHDRVLFVGDTQQHEAVDAGRPYAQLQEAGMHSARLTEIVRQKDAGLRAVVEQLAVGNVESALSGMDKQGRIHEFVGREERIDAIVQSYKANPKGTLIISPDNDSRLEIAQRIHEEMRNTGQVKGVERTVRVLTAKQNLTNEDRRWAQNYEPGDILQFTTSSKAIGVASRESVRVVETQDEKNMITVERQDGKRITYSPERVYGVTAYREAERRFSEGDRVQFSATFHPQNVPNRTLGTIDKITEAGDLTLQIDSGRRVSFNVRQHPYLDYGYAVTSHSSQSETVDNVLIHVDSEHVHKGLINNRMAYVAVSRARFDAQIFTNDAESLAYELSKDVSHSAALQPHEVNEVAKSLNRPGNEHPMPVGITGEGQGLAM